MTDIAESTAPDAAASPADATSATPTEAPLFDAERRATEPAILAAPRAVADPEIGMNGAKRRLGTLAAPVGGLGDLILRFQRELFVVGAQLATNPDAWDRLEDGRTRVSESMVRDLETVLVELESHIEMPREFVVPGETP